MAVYKIRLYVLLATARYAKDLNYCTIHTDLAAPTPIRNLRSEKIASVYHQRREPID
jgi:hypothetical protein